MQGRRSHDIVPPFPALLLATLLLASLALAPRALAEPSPGGMQACGTSRERLVHVLEQQRVWSTQGEHTLPTTQSFDVGEIAVIEDDGTILRQVGSKTEADPVAIARAFYRTHGDDYDFLAAYAASGLNFQVLGGRGFAFEVNVVQDVQGIGLGLWDYSKDFGSAGRLKSYLHMNALDNYPEDPFENFGVTNHTLDILAHEAAHRWAAWVFNDSAGVTTNALLGQGNAHWNFYFDNFACMLGGNQWEASGDTAWVTVDGTRRYGPIEQYLMGFVPADSLDTLRVFQDPMNCEPPANYTKIHHPVIGVTCELREHFFTLDDVIAVNGPRIPDASTAQKHHRFAFVLVIPNGSTPSQADLDKLDNIRTLWLSYWAQITNGNATADVTLDSQAGTVTIEHEGLPDSEDSLNPYPVGAAVAIEPGSIPLAVDASSATLHYGVNGAPLLSTSMSETSPGFFEADIPALPPGSEVRYRIFASSDSSGIDGWWPGPDTTHVFHVGPDTTDPVVTLLARPDEFKHGLLPYRLHVRATDNLGVDSVWAEITPEGGSPATVGLARVAASDTFALDVDPAAELGESFSVRVFAADASSAGNESADAACEPAGSCSFFWGVNWIEPLAPADGGLRQETVAGTPRDTWNWLVTSGPGGAEGHWKGGDPGSLHYLSNLDVALVTPPIPVTHAVELRLDHRYDFEEAGGGLAWDGARVEMSVGGGAWQPITPSGGYPHAMRDPNGTTLPPGTPVYSGRSTGWESGAFEAAVFSLPSLDSATVRFRFRMVSDGFVGGEGWVLDELRLLMNLPGVAVGEPPPGALRFAVPQPNPSRGSVAFAAELPVAATVRLEVFDVRGRRVAAPFQGRAEAGAFRVAWDGRSRGVRAAPGVYLARLTVRGAGPDEQSRARRFVLLP